MVSRTKRFGVEFSIRNGYWLYALYVSPPPQGFSQASFSSNRMTFRPAEASCSAANAPAGPPPRIATRFIFLLRAAGLPAKAFCRSPARRGIPAAVRIRRRRHGPAVRAVSARSRFADDHPFAPLLLQVILHRHSLSCVALGSDSDCRIRLLPVEVDRRDRYVHAGDVQACFGKMVDDALTDRIFIFAAITGGEAQQDEQYCRNSHYSIITGARGPFSGKLTGTHRRI